jgi:hypothetical protein
MRVANAITLTDEQRRVRIESRNQWGDVYSASRPRRNQYGLSASSQSTGA